jgi:hypothetical protein
VYTEFGNGAFTITCRLAIPKGANYLYVDQSALSYVSPMNMRQKVWIFVMPLCAAAP